MRLMTLEGRLMLDPQLLVKPRKNSAAPSVSSTLMTRVPAVAQPIPRLTNVHAVYAGRNTRFAVLSNGTIMTWGAVPKYVRQGGGSPGGSPIPLSLKGLSNPLTFSADIEGDAMSTRSLQT